MKKVNLTSFTTVIAATLLLQGAFANQTYRKHFVKELYTQVGNYQCPKQDQRLHNKLHELLNDQRLINKICSKNPMPPQCKSGSFSLHSEATGLANAASQSNPEFCKIAQEAKTTLRWELGEYLQ